MTPGAIQQARLVTLRAELRRERGRLREAERVARAARRRVDALEAQIRETRLSLVRCRVESRRGEGVGDE